MKNNFFLFLLFVSLANCTQVLSANLSEVDERLDSIQYYYEQSRNKEFSTEKRLMLISKVVQRTSSFKQDTMYLKSIAYRSTILGQVKNYERAIQQATLLLDQAIMLESENYQARAYEKLGRYYRAKNDYANAFINSSKALEKYQELQDYIKILQISKRMANLQILVGDYSGAELTAIEALKVSDKVDDKKEVVWHNDLIAKIYRERTIYNEAIKYHKLAISLELSSKSKASLINNYGVTLIKSRKYKDAITVLKEALIYDGINTKTRNRCLDNISVAMAKLKDPEAEQLMLAALQNKRKDNDIEGVFASVVHLTEFYKSQRNFDKASYWSRQALQVADSIKSPDARIEALGLVIETEDTVDRSQFVEYKTLMDSLTSFQNEYAFQFAKVKFDFKQEQRKAQESQIASQKSDYQRKNAIALTIVILALSSLVFFIQRQMAKRKQLEERFVTESKISKRVHDVLANDMFSIRSELAFQNTQESTLTKLDELYERTRDISKEFSPINTENNYFETLSYMLRAILPLDVKLILKGSDTILWNSISKSKKVALYRSLQELMVNMKKHSNASAVVIAFAKANKNLIVDYKDNGTNGSKQINLGNGLQNVESRISALKGTFTFEITNAIGCEATIEIPL